MTVTHGGRCHLLATGEVFSFGRADTCTVCLDPVDRGISRLAGTVEEEAGTWWIVNRSGVRALSVIDDLGIRSVLAPGRRLAVAGPLTLVVEGSARRHAMEVAMASPPPPPSAEPQMGSVGDAQATVAAGEVLINESDRLAMVALFAGYLEAFPRHDPHPKSYADAATTLGWPRTTLVKRIEYLRTRLTHAGVPTLHGETALSNLAEWALTTGVLTRRDLTLLTSKPPGPRDP